MENKKLTSTEFKILIVLSIAFIGFIAGSWSYSMKLQEALIGGTAKTQSDIQALVEIEKIRNLAESQINKSLSFFLLGSSTIFDEQKRDKQNLAALIAEFEKNHSLPKVPELLRKIESLEQQQQEIFDQAMEFRSKQTESKIVGQFYRSKTNSLSSQISQNLDEIVSLQKFEFEKSLKEAEQAASEVHTLIPKAMVWFSSILVILFLGMALLVIRMLNERTRKISERSRLFEEAKKATQSRDEILSAISEDLKSPLLTIKQTAQLLKEFRQDDADVIDSSVSVIENFVKDILDQSKLDSGSMTLRLDQLPIDTILDDARMTLQPLAKRNNIRLEFNSVNPPALAFMDRERVMRVLTNLIGNAIKFSPQSSKVIIKVRSDQQFIFVSVKDSGPGIPEKNIPHLFDHYWQANKTADQGAGIGLAIVKTIIEAHGGTVTVESFVGHGSTFTFSLPRRRPAGANIGRPIAQSVRTSKANSNELRESL